MDVVDIPRYTEEEVDAYQEVLVQQIQMVHEKVGTTSQQLSWYNNCCDVCNHPCYE